MHPTLARNNPEPVWSPDRSRTYRYRLCRFQILNEAAQNHGTVNFIMLNPSTSTRELSDRTVHNCERLARFWGYENLVVTNLFGYRDVDPNNLRDVEDPVGPENDQHLMEAARDADLRVAAWGSGGQRLCLWRDRATWLRVLLHLEQLGLMCLDQNQDCQPKRPGRIAVANFPRTGLRHYDLPPDLANILAPHLRQGDER